MLSSVFRQTKKVPSILCLTVLLTVCSAPTASAGDLDTVRARGTLRMISWPHQESQFIRRMIEEYGKDGLNRFTGIDVELVRGFAAELGVELEVIPAKDSFSGIFPALQSGQGDLAASSLTITPSRQALFDFSTPYYLERMVVVVPKASTIASVEDLNNKRGAVVTGSSHDQRLRRLAPPGLEVVEVDYTLEALETLGVPVVAYGTEEFPAFFSRSSGHAAPMTLDTPSDLAALMASKWRLGLAGGVAIVNPIPADDEIPAAEISVIIEQALADMEASGIHGKEATPFLLGRIVEITKGASLTANIALVNNNAHLGAQVACAYAAL